MLNPFSDMTSLCKIISLENNIYNDTVAIGSVLELIQNIHRIEECNHCIVLCENKEYIWDGKEWHLAGIINKTEIPSFMNK